MRHATYLINRVATRVLESVTPYEALKQKKPNVGHIRVFGCIGYAKVDIPHLKKLDHRSRILVHLGTEPGSKAYRLYDPTTRKIIVSRDVIFDENKMWNWKRSVERNKETFTITLGEFGNKRIDRDNETAEKMSEEDDTAVITVDQSTEVLNPEEQYDEESTIDSRETLRRSTREKRTPAYLDDYVMLAELDGERLLLSINDEP